MDIIFSAHCLELEGSYVYTRYGIVEGITCCERIFAYRDEGEDSKNFSLNAISVAEQLTEVHNYILIPYTKEQ